MNVDGCKTAVVTPWANAEQKALFLQRWSVQDSQPPWLILQQDMNREGCGATKNKGVRRAMEASFDAVVILDDDCFPSSEGPQTLEHLVEAHVRVLSEVSNVMMYEDTTIPESRGTPYHELAIEMPVAASMGFWTDVGDHCAVRQLASGGASMSHLRKNVFGRYFSLCGMNLAFKPADWMPWCRFIEVPRFDDIWMGWLWQREAYRRGFCFSLTGPDVKHSRQSNVWKNLREEVEYLEESETLWRRIALNDQDDYRSLRKLLPC